MIHIHRTILRRPWKGRKHIAQLWYNYNTTDFPYLTKLNMYPILDNGTVGECVSSATDNGKGENKITLDDRFAALMILIDDGIIDDLTMG